MSDELRLPIPKHHWRPAVTRGLQPQLRALGDKHGNIVLAAQAQRGEILVKGDPEKIQAAKADIAKLIAEHFPDADMPEELTGKKAQALQSPKGSPKTGPSRSPKGSPMMEPSRAAARPAAGVVKKTGKSGKKRGRPHTLAAAAEAKRVAAAAAEHKQAVEKVAKIKTYKPAPPSASAAPADLLWAVIRKDNSFIRKRPNMPVFSGEPNNIKALHSFKYSSVANLDLLGVESSKNGKKESISLVQRHPKGSNYKTPETAVVKTGLSKCPKRGLETLERKLNMGHYRRDLMKDASTRYLKVQKSFRKRTKAVLSRRKKGN